MTVSEVTTDGNNALPDDPFGAWFAPTLDPSTLRGLMHRTNLQALVTLGAWIIACVATASLVVISRHSWWMLPAMTLYGGVLSFAYAASHECAHGTAFKSRWLNETVFWITSLIFIEEPLYRRYSHAGHHTNTWFNRVDPQKPYGNPMTVLQYATVSLGLSLYVDAARQLLRHSTGQFTDAERGFLPTSEIRKVSRNSRIMGACYITLLFSGLVFLSTWPLLLYFVPRFLGGCIINSYINTQHMCMAEDQRDHRQTTRSIRCSWPERLLYWNMNFHIEHHLYPAVPFHALPKLNAHIRSELPTPSRGVVAANIEILAAIARQVRDPRFNLSGAHNSS
jgi:fatty acid desaturase